MGNFLVSLLIVLIVVTLVGHGIWTLLAAIFRALAAPPGREGTEKRVRCPRCGYATPAHLAHCAWCNKPLRGDLADELSDLTAFRRQLGRLGERGVVEPAEVESLSARIAEYENRLRQPPPVSRPAEAAPPPPVLAQVVEPAAPPPVTSRLGDSLTRVEPLPEPPKPEPAKPAAEPRPAPAARPVPKPPPPAPPPPPKKSWMELVAEFFEERNVRVAEVILVLVGGLLIVGGSVAVVISFWEQMESYLKFAVFVGISSAVFGLGLVAYHRWKLEISGRGLLVIATLLVPLNFLAMASLSREQWNLLTLATELVSLVIFVYLVGLASQVLVPGRVWHQVLAVVGNSAAVLLVARLTGEGAHGWPIGAIAALPVGIMGVALGGYLFLTRRQEPLEPRQADGIFTLAGTAGFALAIALGLLISKGARTDGLAITLEHVAPLLTLAAIPFLSAGLTVKGRIGDGASLGAYRTAGTALALIAVTVMIGSLALAWPRPWGVMAAGAFDAGALAYVAFRHRLPVAHAGAIACAAFVYLIGFHLAAGHLDWNPSQDQGRRMIELALDAQSGTALVGLFGLLALAGEWLARRGLRSHAVQYVGGSAVIALVSLLLVTVHNQFTGGASCVDAMLVYGVYGTCSLAMAARWQRRWFSYLGLGLLVGTTLWALRWQMEHVEPVWGAVLAGEGLAMGLLAAAMNRLAGQPPRLRWDADAPTDRGATKGTVPLSKGTVPFVGLIEVYRLPLLHVAEAVGVVALGFALWAFDRAHTPAPIVTAVCLAALYFLTAWGYRSRERTWVASAVVLLGLIHTLVWNYGDWVDRPWVVALLTHATLAASASTILTFSTRPRGDAEPAADLRRVFVGPLVATSLISSTVALPIMLVAGRVEALLLAEYLYWLAAIWLVIAWTEGRPGWFTAAQAVLTLATVTATTAWLERHPWNAIAAGKGLIDLHDPRTLQAYGIGLAVLSLVWVVVRIVFRKNTEAQRLLDPGWTAVDRVVGHSVVVAQLLLAAGHVALACGRELIDRAGPAGTWQLVAFGPTAWLLAGLLAVMLAAALWHRWRDTEVLSGLMAAATLVYLAAGQFVAEGTAATAASWALAFGFVLLGAVIWQRRWLLAACLRIGAKVELGQHCLAGCQAVVLAATAVPALVVTICGALLRIQGISPLRPAAESLLGWLDPNAAYAVPHLLLIVGLVGFALRERSAGYAFCAGLVAQIAVVLGYLVSLATGSQSLETAAVATSLQLATITAAVWAIVWLAARRWVHAWREGPEEVASRALMDVQLGMGVLGNTVLLVPALVAIALFPAGWHAWAIQAGSPWGWAALVLAVAAVVFREAQLGQRLSADAAGLAGMAAVGLLACTVRGLPPHAADWAYRTLMLGWAAYAVLVAAATWWLSSRRTEFQALVRPVSRWTAMAGILAVFLGLKAAFFHAPWEELLWAAAAIGLAAAACATMAVWRRREGWAFAAALGVNLAASLVVWYCEWHSRRYLTLEDWWVHLLQANVIASAVAAMVWLAARRRLYAVEKLTVGASPLLAVQTALGPVATAILLIPALFAIAWTPGRLPPWIGQVAGPAGWAALALVAVSAAWYLRRFSPRGLMHVAAGLGLGAGTLAACFSEKWNLGTPWGDWLAYHVLESAWAIVGLTVLGLGLFARNWRAAGQGEPASLEDASQPVFPSTLMQAWVTWIGAAVVGLALLHAKGDPAAPWWSVGAILAVSLCAGILAMALRLAVYVVISGLLINVAGTVMWLVWGPWNPYALVEFYVVCLAIASGIWSVVGLAYRPGPKKGTVPFFGPSLVAHAAAELAVVLVAILAAILVVHDIQLMPHPAADRLAWLALSATAVALGICLWDRTAGFVLPGLYALGLATLGLSWDARELVARRLAWASGWELAGFALVAALVGLILPRVRPVWRALGIPLDRKQTAAGWFPAAQAAAVGVAAALAAWISIDLGFDAVTQPVLAWPAGRMAGLAASILLLPAAGTMAAATGNRWRTAWQYIALGLGVLLFAAPGWALLQPKWGDLGMHRSVVLMVAAVIMALASGFGLERIVSIGSDWVAAGSRAFPALAALALLVLVATLGQEFYHYVPDKGAPMALPAVVIVAAALAGLVVGCLACAVAPRLDPFGLSDHGRTVYVYAAEAILLVIGVHLRLTVPHLFHLAIVAKYWMLLLMAVAFAGAGLSEWFHRRGQAVLSEPLERTAMLVPLVPAIGFWFVPEFQGHEQWLLAGRSPAVWFLAAIFYGFLAATRRGAWQTGVFTLLSLAAANVGLSVMWYQIGREFFWEHPQVWLIPIGLSILLAEYFNRDGLTPAQSAGIRYLALCVIYIPSSAEYLQNLQKIGESIWRPLVLILLSLVGVLAGIVLRIRSFLYLGVTFLALVIVTMVRYAAVDLQKTWVLYLCCIFLGAVTIALVALYEKRRDAILAAIKQFRAWQK